MTIWVRGAGAIFFATVFRSGRVTGVSIPRETIMRLRYTAKKCYIFLIFCIMEL